MKVVESPEREAARIAYLTVYKKAQAELTAAKQAWVDTVLPAIAKVTIIEEAIAEYRAAPRADVKDIALRKWVELCSTYWELKLANRESRNKYGRFGEERHPALIKWEQRLTTEMSVATTFAEAWEVIQECPYDGDDFHRIEGDKLFRRALTLTTSQEEIRSLKNWANARFLSYRATTDEVEARRAELRAAESG